MPPREKSPGLKILWIWTFGTAAILIANVMRTRLRDFENVMNNAEQQQQHDTAPKADSPTLDTLIFPTDPDMSEDKD